MKDDESEKYITSKDKTKTKQNGNAGWTTETTMMSEQRLILEVMARSIGIPQTLQDDVNCP
jgi:hypothetical protein